MSQILATLQTLTADPGLATRPPDRCRLSSGAPEGDQRRSATTPSTRLWQREANGNAVEPDRRRGHRGDVVAGPRAFGTACAQLGVRPEECLFVDDVAVNVEAARAAGMQGHLFVDNAATIARITAHVERGRAGA